MKYRVILQIGGYRYAYFDFEEASEAIAFANTAVKNNVASKDDALTVTIKIAENFDEIGE